MRYRGTMHLNKTILPLLASVCILASCKKDKTDSQATGPTTCTQSRPVSNGDIIPGQYIVTYNAATIQSRGMSASRLTEAGKDALERNQISAQSMKASFAGDAAGFVASLSREEAASLGKDASIKSIEPDRVVALATCWSVAEPRLITWNIRRVGYGNGVGKNAWIIDTGIDFDHPDLTVDVNRSKSFITGENADDGNGHGTHVAGIIGGKNNTYGVLGVASGANLISLKVLKADGEGTLSAVIQALAHVNTNGAAGDVVNLSLGEEISSPALNSQVQATASKGIYIAIAAGNENEPANKYSPGNANGTNIYTVSAVDSLDNFASFSNYGNDVVDYAAPGVRILSTYSEGRYAYLSGTSMAAPHVAGLLLLRGRNISASGSAVNDPDGNPDPIAHY